VSTMQEEGADNVSVSVGSCGVDEAGSADRSEAITMSVSVGPGP
jgi:hypothetical protein